LKRPVQANGIATWPIGGKRKIVGVAYCFQELVPVSHVCADVAQNELHLIVAGSIAKTHENCYCKVHR